MAKADEELVKAINNVLNNGFLDENPRPKYSDGTPAHTLSVNHVSRVYDIGRGEFPITSLRRIAWKTAIKEILWIYQDADNTFDTLHNKYNIKYWDLWESKKAPGTIGARYGEIVRRYGLMEKLLDELKKDPFGRRHIIDLYQYKELEETDGLYPCAFLTIWNVRKENGELYLDLSLIQRSGDLLTASCSGVNEVQYAALLMMVAHHCGFMGGRLHHFVANEQIYDRHIPQALDIVSRFKSNHNILCPKLKFCPIKSDFYSYTINDFILEDYNPIEPNLQLDLGI